MNTDKKILDACCGSRMFWFDKNNPDVLFIDKRRETVYAKDSSSRNGIRTIEVNPDVIADFTELPMEDESFYMVVFDPPHLKTLGETSWMAKKYGKLYDNWKEVLKKGFDECMRVLKPNGSLIFKWNESEIKANDVLAIIPYKPLFGHTTGRQSKTIWMAFMKPTTFMNLSICDQCGEMGENEKHACPFSVEVYNDSTPDCNCCDGCTKKCLERV